MVQEMNSEIATAVRSITEEILAGNFQSTPANGIKSTGTTMSMFLCE
jgi:hypothetical protein